VGGGGGGREGVSPGRSNDGLQDVLGDSLSALVRRPATDPYLPPSRPLAVPPESSNRCGKVDASRAAAWD
jgi:hypothetical protein